MAVALTGGTIAAAGVLAATHASPAAPRTPPAAVMLIKRSGPHGERMLARIDGYLTGRRKGDAAAIARAFISRRRGELGLNAAGVASLRVVRRVRSPARVTYLTFAQVDRGIPVYGAGFDAAVDRDGRILNVSGTPERDVSAPAVAPRLSAGAALRQARRALGAPRQPAGTPAAKLVLLPQPGTDAYGWRLTLDVPSRGLFDVVLDDATGALVDRRDLQSDATVRAYTNHPNAAIGGGSALYDVGSQITAPDKLLGDALHAYADLDGNDVADPGEEVGPSAAGTWDYPRLTAPGAHALCPFGCTWDHITANSWRGASDGGIKQAATQAFFFVGRFLDHLAEAHIGFSDANDGFGTADPVQIEVLDTASKVGGLPEAFNNANFSTPANGSSPRMQSYLFKPVGSIHYGDVHGGDDAGVVYHEVGHGLTARLITDAGGVRALERQQSDALSEGWSDFMAMSYLTAAGLRPDTGANGELVLAPYEGDPRALRSEGLDCPVGAAAPQCPGGRDTDAGGYSYGDYGHVVGKPEVHADGEIWAQTLWDLRAQLGATDTEQLVVEGMRLTPDEPSFLDARDAILQADVVLHAGAHAATIWQVFATRGMGYFASTIDANDDLPLDDYTVPPAPGGPTGTLHGTVAERQSLAGIAGVTVRLGGHDSGFPFSLTTTTDATGAYSFSGLVPGVYRHVIASHASYERIISGDVTVAAGDQVHNMKARRNWAAVSGGAFVLDPSPSKYTWCPAAAALDGDFNTGWCDDVGQARVLRILLPQSVNVTSIAIDPRARSARSDLDATASAKDYVVETATQASPNSWRLAAAGAFTALENGTLNPIDMSPQLHVGTRYVRVTITNPQGNFAAGTSSHDYMGLAEVQVFATVNTRPVAAISHTPSEPRTGEEVAFSAAGSSDPDGTIVKYEWDLDGNGSFERSTGVTPAVTRSYADPVDVSARVRVTDDKNETRVATEPLSVTGAAIVTGLGRLGGDTSAAGRINAVGQIAGEADTTPGSPSLRAFRWEAGTISDLGSTSTRSIAFAINAGGQSTGYSYATGSDRRATLFPGPGTPPVDLGTLGGAESNAEGINDAGTIVGWAQIGTPEHPRRAFVRPPGGPMTSLGTLDASPGASDASDAWDISAGGHVVGWSNGNGATGASYHAFLWSGAGALADLGTIGGRWNIATAINNSDTIGGYGEAPSLVGFHAWVRSPLGELTDLGTFGGSDSAVRDIDNRGQAVGYATLPDGSPRAFLWRSGRMINLNTLLPARSTWTLLSANGINEADQISGWGLHDGQEEAFLLDLGGCSVCVTGLELEHEDVPSGTLKRLKAGATYDGNRVTITATIENKGTTDQVFNVKFIDTKTGAELPGTATPLAINHGDPPKTVEVEWDTTGKAWDDAGNPASDRGVRVLLTVGPNVLDERVHTIKIKPRPAFLVHGLWSDATTWSQYPALMQAAHPDWEVLPVAGMDTGQQLSLSHMPNTIYENAQVLDSVINTYRADHDAQRIDLIGHSMGGLISRMWINTFMPDPGTGPPIARHLIQLGTPNQGSACADVLFRADTVELRRAVTADFNNLVTKRKGVRFSVAVGTPLPFTCIDLTAGDSVVSQTSAEWEISDHVTNGLMHTAMTGDAALFGSFVKPRLSGTVAVAPPPAAPLARARATALVAPDPPELTDGDLFTMATGTTRDFTAKVSDAGRVGFVLAAPPGVGAQLIAPDTTVAAEIAAGSPEAQAFIRSGAVNAPAVGTWTLHLTNTAAAAPVSAQVFETGSALTLAVDGGSIDFRRRSTIHATLRDGGSPVTGAIVSVTARRADGSAQPLRLVDDGSGGDSSAGDGVYTGRSGELRAGRWLLVGQADLAGGRRRMTTGDLDVPVDAPAAPATSPLAGRIAYSRAKGVDKHIFTIAATGGTARRITDGAVDDEGPAWSADGAKIAFARKVGAGTFDLWTVNADATGLTQLTSSADDDTNPAWSPDGTKLVFRRGGDLWTISSTGADATALTSDGGASDDNRPSWSPDGTTIAFDRTAAGNADLYTVPAAGGPPAVVLAALNSQVAPDWSPDGRDLLYSDGALGLRLVDASSGGIVPVQAAGANGALSPAGDRLVYQSGSDLFVAKADGSAGTALMQDALVQADPDWTAATTEPPARVPVCPNTTAKTSRVADRPALVALPCADPDEQPITLAIVTPPAHGSLGAIAGTPPNSYLTYTPAADYVGPDSFTYKATNATGDSAAGTATIDVRAFATDDPHVDRTFGVQGHVLTSVGSSDQANDVAVQSGGKLLVAGTANSATMLLRYEPDGTLDASYGTAGRAPSLPGTGVIEGVAVDGLDRAVVVGRTGGSELPVVARYTSAGALDTTFSGDGVLQLGGALRIFYDVAIAAGNAVVVAGAEYQNTGHPLMMVARATEAGVLDTTFSGDGLATLVFPTAGSLARAVAVEPDDQVVVAGEAQTYPTSQSILVDTGVGRLNANGTPDTGFGTNGTWVKEFIANKHDWAKDVLVDGDGRILVGGQTDLPDSAGRVFTLSRLSSAGAPDAAFAGAGSQAYGGPFELWPFETMEGVALEGDGSLWAGGSAYLGTDITGEMIAARFGATGAIDPAFSDDGYAATFFGPAGDGGNATALQSPGKLVVAGQSGGHVALTRFSTVPFVPPGGGQHTPVCADGSVSLYNDEATTITFSCSDADGDPLTFAVSGGPGHGALTDLNASAGTAVYHPAAGYVGGDEVTFTATDPSTRSAGGHVAITVAVRPPPPPPPPPTGGGTTVPEPTPAPSGGGGTTNPPSGGDTTNESGGGRSCVVGSAGCPYPVSCPPEAAGTCNGDASNQTRGGRSTAVVGQIAAAKRLFRTVKFSIPAGRTKKLHLKLTTAGRKLLRKKRRVKTGIVVRFIDKRGHVTIRRGTVTFKQARRVRTAHD